MNMIVKNKKIILGLFLFSVFLVSASLAWAIPNVQILEPNHDQENNRVFPLTLNVTDPNLQSVTYNYNGTNYTYTSSTFISGDFGKVNLRVWASDSSGNITFAERKFNLSYKSQNELSVLIAFVFILIFIFCLSKSRLFNGEKQNEEGHGLKMIRASLYFLMVYVLLVMVQVLILFLNLQYNDTNLTVLLGVVLTVIGWATMIAPYVFGAYFFYIMILGLLMIKKKKQDGKT